MSEAAPESPAYPRRRGLLVVSVMLATTIYALDWTIASIALPHMQGTFSVTQDQISWVLTSYIVASAVMLPAAGWLSRRFGRKRLFLSAVGGFIVASMLCGAAQSLAAEIIFRILQGMSGAFLVPISQAIVLDIYPREQHGKAMAYWGMGVMMGPVLGPTLGGYLTELYTWRWVFYINLPIGIVALLGCWAFLPETVRHRDRRFDWLGFLALAFGVGALQVMLDRGERLDWFDSPEILIEAAVSVLGIYLFVAHSLTTRDPFLNLRLLRDRNYAVGLAFIFLYGLLTLAPIILMPPFLEDLRDYPIITIGLLLSPRGLGLMTAMLIAGRITGRVDPRALVGVGFMFLAIASWSMSGWNLEVGTWDVAWTGFLQGMGAGTVLVPLGAATFFSLDPENRTEGTSVFNLMRSLGSAVGISIAIRVLTSSTTTNRAELVRHVNPFNEMLRDPSTFELWNLGTLQGLAAIDAEITRQATMIGYLNVFHLIMIASFVALPMLLLLRKPELVPESAPSAAR